MGQCNPYSGMGNVFDLGGESNVIRNRYRARQFRAFESLEKRQLLAVEAIPALMEPEGAIDHLVEVRLDVTQNGTSIVDQNRHFNVDVGERFDLEVRYDDLRVAPENIGAFVLGLNIIASSSSGIRPAVGEVQLITLENALNSNEGSIEISATNTIRSQTVSDLSPANIRDAVAFVLDINAADVRINFPPSFDSDDVIVEVSFHGNEALKQIDNLTVDTSGLTGATVTAVFDEIPAFVGGNPSAGVNPDAFIFAIDTRSSTFNDLDVYQMNGGSFNQTGSPIFASMEAVGPFAIDGLAGYAADNSLPYDGQNIEVFSIPMEAFSAATGVQLVVEFDSSGETEFVLYPGEDSLSADSVLFDTESNTDQSALVIANIGEATNSPFQNPDNRFDVDGGGVSASDFLRIVNELQNRTLIAADGSLPANPTLPVLFFWDVNGDNFVTVDDANEILAQLDQPLLLDFGDAPTAAQSGYASSYPTTLADNGARHHTGALRLGQMVDTETDGIPSADADGDGDDEDGVIANTPLQPGQSTELAVTVTGSGKLDAWIDFNRDGDWEDVGEQVFDGIDVSMGVNTRSFTVPATVTSGELFGRFRLTSAGIGTPTGEAPDGEVEDHRFTVVTDGGTDVNLTIGDNTVLSVQDGEFVITTDSTEVFRQAVATLGDVVLTGTTADERLTFDFGTGEVGSGDFNSLSSLTVNGSGGNNTLAVIGVAADLNLASDSNIFASNFQTLDLSNTAQANVVVNADVISQLSPTTNIVSFIGDKTDDTLPEDEMIFEDQADWRMTDPIAGTEFLLTATHQTSGQQVEASLLRPWRNFVSPSDINNDGVVQASDALRIINAIFRGEFRVTDSETLLNPGDVGTWPGVYPDQNGDNKMTALDALRVINELARQSDSEAEAIAILDTVLTELDDYPVEAEPQRFALQKRVAPTGQTYRYLDWICEREIEPDEVLELDLSEPKINGFTR